MAEQANRWRKDKDFALEDLYLKFEKLVDVFLIEGETKIVQEMERERIRCEGDVEKMGELCKGYAEKLWAILNPKAHV